jgi:cellulose synthase/poly-beta-1,6-N-acetylglucosamine synthase-like glycosyltransferase
MDSKECKENFEVTIGICVKNCERTIKDAIISLVNQSFDKKRMEVIIIDDGCKDRTIPIITHFFPKVDLKLRIYSTNNGGLTMARQMIIDKACGYLVFFIDGDMVFSKDFVQKLVELMEKNPLIGAAQGTMKGKKSSSSLSILEDLSFSNNFGIGIHRKWRDNPQALGTGGTVFRVDAMKKAGGFDTRIKGAAEDADLTARVKSAGYSLAISEAEFEHEFKETLRALWKQYSWYGFGMHYFYHKHGTLNEQMLVTFLPLTYAWGLIRSLLAFKATRKKIAFFLPPYNSFRAIAWWSGFFTAHVKGYGHEYKSFKGAKNDNP